MGEYNETVFIEEFGCLLPKFHTLRANFPLWEKRIEEVNAGRARLSIRYWSGVPYKSIQVEFASLTECGIQKVMFAHQPGYASVAFPFIIPSKHEDPQYRNVAIHELSKNDALSINDFKAWFKGYDLSKPLAIIQFTTFRY